MNHRLSSIFGFGGTLAAALIGAAAMTTDARAEGPIGEPTPFTSQRSRADVHAELMADRQAVSSFGSEWAGQQTPMLAAGGVTRAQAQAAYIAARDQVQAMHSEHGGAGFFASRTMRSPDVLIARTPAN